MPWHDFVAGETYAKSDVVAACEKRLSTGKVRDAKKKRHYVEEIQQAAQERLVFQPKGAAWGVSPFNLNSWQTPEGGPIN